MKVAVIYHQFPHYRAPILKKLATSERYEYEFWASTSDFFGIKAFKGDETVRIQELRVSISKNGFRVNGYASLLRNPSIGAFLIIGNPNIFATWVLAILGRLQGKKIFFWTHGWLQSEPFPKSLIRYLYYRLSHTLLVYGERSKRMGEHLGFPPHKIRVIYNSLDFEYCNTILQKLETDTLSQSTKCMFEHTDRPLIICTARLTNLCRFDLLIDAANILKRRNFDINVLLVGDGPERNALEEHALSLSVDVKFFGSCYDEQSLAKMIYDADATVSPGKIGLAAIHSLSYGTPAFTHSDLDNQMPEVEVILPGQTGDLFKSGDATDLANTLQRWLQSGQNRQEVRSRCIAAIANKWTPENQRRCIEAALDTCILKSTP